MDDILTFLVAYRYAISAILILLATTIIIIRFNGYFRDVWGENKKSEKWASNFVQLLAVSKEGDGENNE